jgi:hypothetical protein
METPPEFDWASRPEALQPISLKAHAIANKTRNGSNTNFILTIRGSFAVPGLYS